MTQATKPKTLTQAMSLPGQLKLRSNGEGAKTAAVRIVAYSGDIVYFEGLGAVVTDLDTLTYKSKIPLDWAHEGQMGYANNIDVIDGSLIASGVIDIADFEGSDVSRKLEIGVPYEASIETWSSPEDFEFVPENALTVVNGRAFEGPLTIIRNATLKAIAVCKFGRDANTEVVLQQSIGEKSPILKKGIAIRIKKYSAMEENTIEQTVEATATATATEAPAAEQTEAVVEVVSEEVAAPAAPAETEAVVETVETPATPEAEAVEAVDAPTPAEAPKSEEKAVVTASASEAPAAVAADPRSEAKKFISTFGETQGVKYFAEGKSFDDALVAHMSHQQKLIESLEKRLQSSDRGASTPIAFSDHEERTKASKTFKDVISLGTKNNK